MAGTAGLAEVARASGAAEDYRAWCSRLARERDWTGALAACEEAASRVPAGYRQAEFLDGAATCAQELRRRDLPERLEQAWRADPDLCRLVRWLGVAGSPTAWTERLHTALHACPKNRARQRGLLEVLSGDLAAAAKTLAAAPGLGWSDEDHPGHLLFPLFQSLLEGGSGKLGGLRLPRAVHELLDPRILLAELDGTDTEEGEPGYGGPGGRDLVDSRRDEDDEDDGDQEDDDDEDDEDDEDQEDDDDEDDGDGEDDDEGDVTGGEGVGEADLPGWPPLPVPTVEELLSRASVRHVTDAASRRVLIDALKEAAERRLDGVTQAKRRRHYGHAAGLAAAVVACDPSPAATRWVASLREKYRRFYALRGELDRHLGRA